MRMNLKFCTFFVLVLYLLSVSGDIFSKDIQLTGDRIFLKNGRMIEGSIVQEKDDYIKIKVDGISDIKISRDNIQYIKKASEDAIKEVEQYEKENINKGMVKYKDKWVTQDEYQKLTSKDSLDEEVRLLRMEKQRLLTEINALHGKRLYEDKKNKFSFNPPEEWKQVTAQEDQIVGRFIDPLEDDFPEYINIYVNDKTSNEVDQDFIDISLKNLQEEKKGYLKKVRSFDVAKVDGLNALKVIMSSYFFKDAESSKEVEEPYHQKMIVYLIIGKTKLYRVEFSCLTKDYDRYSPVFENCIKSFLINDRPGEISLPKESGIVQAETNEDTVPVASTIGVAEEVSKISEPAKEFGVDKIFLKDKRVVEGTILQESPENVKIRVESASTPEYALTVSKNDIDKIEWLGEDERQKKLEYEEQQRLKGLVKFYGKWITPEDRDNFYRQAESEQQGIVDAWDEDKKSREELSQQEQISSIENRKDEEIQSVLTKLKKMELEKEELQNQLYKQKDITNKKLDKFLERDRQQIPVGKVATGSMQSIVKVFSRDRYTAAYQGKFKGSGSGAIINSRGIIITNYYISDNPSMNDYFVELPGHEKREVIKAKLLQYDPILDVAILSIDGEALKLVPLPIGNSDTVTEGDEILSVGAPKGYKDSFISGNVLSLKADLIDLIESNLQLRWNLENKYRTTVGVEMAKKFHNEYGIVKMIQHNALMYSGNNGGPLLDKNSALIGINQNIRVEGRFPVVLAPTTLSFNMALSINSLKKQRKFARYLR